MKIKQYFSMRKGFTLIELLVVISIIALLTGILMVNFTQSKAKARDAKRVSDLNQIQLALEQYFDRCGQYPDETINSDLSLTTNISNGCPTSPQITLASYISKIPTDPSPTGSYTYRTNGTKTDYVLHALLEYGNAAQQNSLPPGSQIGNDYMISCYDSSTPTVNPLHYCIGPK